MPTPMPEAPYNPVVRQVRLPFQVAEQIQGLILARHFQVGDRLPPERDLCEQFKVSRTVIREAIRLLEAKGLIISYGGSGSYVSAIQSSDVVNSLEMYIATQNIEMPYADLMEIRRVIEVQVAVLAAERAKPDDIAQLDQILQNQRFALNDPALFAQYDLEFHMSMARATGNHLFELILSPIVEPLYEGRRLSSEIPGVAQEAINLHQAVLDRIKSGDAEGAGEAMSAHLEQSSLVTLQALIEKSKQVPQSSSHTKETDYGRSS
jgi:GntR family transcriptional regulator, transcriptional repressor for pyruvate dehydrogenase complex